MVAWHQEGETGDPGGREVSWYGGYHSERGEQDWKGQGVERLALASR